MKKIIVLLTVIVTFAATAQKPALTIDDLGKWPSVSNPKLSNNGKFVLYTYNEGGQQSLFIKSTDVKWEKQFLGTSSYQAVFTENSRYMIAKVIDTLKILELKTAVVESMQGVFAYATPLEGTGEWLAYQLDNEKRELVLLNLLTRKEKRFTAVNAFQFSADGKGLLLKTELSNSLSQLQWLVTSTGKLVTIWQGGRAESFVIDASGIHLAFIGEDPKDKAGNAVWYYTPGMNKAEVIVDNSTFGISKGLIIKNELPRFNNKGSRVFFYLEPLVEPTAKREGASVDVWSYHDAKLMAQQLVAVNKTNQFLTVLDLAKPGRVVQLEKEHEEVVTTVENLKGDYALLHYRKGDYQEAHWNPLAFLSVYLVNLSDGSRKPMKEHMPLWSGFFSLSPDEKFVINFDSDAKTYFSYEIATGIKRNVTKRITVPLNGQKGYPVSKFSPYGFGITWSKNDRSFIICDEFDLWAIDPLGIKAPVNITNGYGRLNNIVFRLMEEDKVIVESNEIITTGVNKTTINNGFYKINLEGADDPNVLNECHCIQNSAFGLISLKPQKARNAQTFLVNRQSAADPPNYFITRDFKEYKQITNLLSPNKRLNWFTTELVNWKTYDSLESKGILYKPGNFDATRKYPVIFYFYEELSNRLNEFNEPQCSSGELPIPYFVSNGYLVFVPDIQFKHQKVGQGAYNSVLSAARFLSQIPYIDSTRMAIMGHSFGGYEVNYLITQTSYFAAAVSAAGMTNLVSYYGSAARNNGFTINWSEQLQGRMDTSLWGDSNLYIENSPIFYADKITTPLLMMYSKNDRTVPFAQGIELFTALRRLGKRVWMLQYDNGHHQLDNPYDEKDFTIRLKQFFDHYLKGVPAPTWMTRGIPAKLKGVADGLELDHEIKTPTKGLTNN